MVQEKLADLRNLWREISSRITLRRDSAPIDSVARLNDFVSTRSAFIAQKTLYGYLKTRMGTRYPTLFEDDIFVQSINIAKLRVFAACLSDLTIHAVANATQGQAVTDDGRCALAGDCYRAALTENATDAPTEFSAQGSLDDFLARLRETDWSEGALHRENFTCSPDALVHWAPIAPELKKFDREIVENSIKFAWQDIRRQFDRRMDRDAISADLPPLS